MSADEVAAIIAESVEIPSVESAAFSVVTEDVSPPPDPLAAALQVRLARIEADPRSAHRTRMLQGAEAFEWMRRHGKLVVQSGIERLEGAYWIDLRSDAPRVRGLLHPDSVVALAEIVGMNSTTKEFREVRDFAAQKAIASEVDRVQIHKWWARSGEGAEASVYLSAGPGKMVKVSSCEVVGCHAGADGILIPEESGLPKWNLLPKEDSMLPDALTVLNTANMDQGEKLLLSIAAIVLPMASKSPLVTLDGPNGSGKTTILKCLGMIYDPKFEETRCSPGLENTFDRLCNEERLIVLDNLDKPAEAKWVPEALSAKSTGAQSVEKKLYANGESFRLASNANFWLSSVDAGFLLRDGGFATRAILLRCGSAIQETEDESLTSEVILKRDNLLSGVAYSIQAGLSAWSETKCKFRFPSWSRCVLAVARSWGQHAQCETVLRRVFDEARLRSISESEYGQALLALLPDAGNQAEGTAKEIIRLMRQSEYLDHPPNNVKDTAARGLGNFLAKSAACISALFTVEKKIIHGETKWNIKRK